MPPIPEDAVVIADYMLMADHIVRTATTVSDISKGGILPRQGMQFFSCRSSI